MSRAPFDLGYMHEMATLSTAAVPRPAPKPDEARDLTARLRCLKALVDAEREPRPAAAPRHIH